LSGINSYVPVWNTDFWSSTDNRQLGLDLLDWSKTANRVEESKKAVDEFKGLPASFTSMLRESTVLVFPWELSYAQTGQFRLWPLYTLQAYVAYSKYLDTMTASQLRAASSQIDYVLFEWKSLDRRHPLLDVPATWSQLFDEYEPVLSQPGKMVLGHRKVPLQHSLGTSFDSRPFPIGQWIELPRRSAVLWAKIDIPYSREGFWRKALFKADAMYLSAGRASGGVEKYRIVPDVLSSAFPLNIMPLDFNDLQTLWGTSRVDDPIIRVRLDSDSPNDYGRPRLELYGEQASEIKVDENKLQSFRSKFGVDSAAQITNTMQFDLDFVDKASPLWWPDEGHPWLVRRSHPLELKGWSATADKSSTFDSLYAVINGRNWVRAVTVPRVDVANYLKNNALDLCGYTLTIPTSGMAVGVQRLDIVGVVNKTKQLYRANPMYIEVR
jgi:hypothetical protein